MSNFPGIPVWKKAPLIRVLIPFCAGVVLQWYQQFPPAFILLLLISFCCSYFLFFLLPLSLRFNFRIVQGVILQLLIIAFGLLITWQKDIRNQDDWYGHFSEKESILLVRIDEPLVEKDRTYKALGFVEKVVQHGKVVSCRGRLLLYFSKDSSPNKLKYGDRILIRKELQLIKNSGNPGAFNYQRYAAFQQQFHQVFLKEKDWIEVNSLNKGNIFREFIFNARNEIIATLQSKLRAGNPDSYRDDLGIAEALLIGYTNDLDKDLVQAYSNTGVVHIIAISGMHLGLIYVLLLWLFARMPLIKRSKMVKAALVLACLWLFSLLTGGSASVVRSAMMFTFILIGETIFARQSYTFGSLAASAFVMLCYNPYYLWDVGFQLSYLAVTGIVTLQRQICNIFYIKNKWLDKVWQLMAVSLAAQLLTFPVCIFYFHQFPNLFLLTNMIAVPLSAVILYAEIGLIALSGVPQLGGWMGKLVAELVSLMNRIILCFNELPLAVWDNIPASTLSTWLLYGIVVFFSMWLIQKNKTLFKSGLICLLFFLLVMAYSKWQAGRQQKIIVYNIPRHQAIDFVDGNSYRFVGDSSLLENGILQNFHLKPARILMQLSQRSDSLTGLFQQLCFYQFYDKTLVIFDGFLPAGRPTKKIYADVVVLSKNPPVSIAQLNQVFNCRYYVFDASCLAWKIKKWEEECRGLDISYHTVSEQGAFIMDIGM